jgi:acyl carrier protein
VDLDETRDEIRTLVIQLAPSDSVNPNGNDLLLVDHLEYHSLALLELAFVLEDEYDLPPIDEATAQLIRTVDDVVEYVVGHIAARRSA